MTSPEWVQNRRKQLHARDVRGLFAFVFTLWKKKIVNKSCFQSILQVQTIFVPISRPDEHAELLKSYFKPLVKKLKFSTLVAKSDWRFKIHYKWEKNSLVPGRNSNPSGEISLSYMDTHDGLL